MATINNQIMKKNLMLIFFGLTFLTTALFIGTPFEFLNPTVDIVATLFIMLLILLLFIYIFRLTRHIDKKGIKWLTFGLTCLLAIPYLLIGIWTILLTASSYHPMWQDVSIYTNNNGAKVISQWRRTSGSIYDYRDRRILGDFGQFRISLDCNKKYLHGLWAEYNIEKNSTSTIDFDKNK
jgi:hypothetical protein